MLLLRERSYPVRCPVCGADCVRILETQWQERGAGPWRRSVYCDEPLRCASGCTLSANQVEALLRQVYDRTAVGAFQLPLWGTAASPAGEAA